VKIILLELPVKFPQATLDEWVIMPDHIHLIIIIHEPIPRTGTGTKNYRPTIGNNPMQAHNVSLGGIIRWLKAKSTFEIHKISADFGWQARFHDHIIRSEAELLRIRRYIRNNPLQN